MRRHGGKQDVLSNHQTKQIIEGENEHKKEKRIAIPTNLLHLRF